MEEIAGVAMWTLWWVWLAAAVGLAILELFAPGFVLLGFAAGAAIVGGLLGVGGPISAYLAGSFAATFLVFAVASLIAWLIMRRFAGIRRGQVKVWETDINED